MTVGTRKHRESPADELHSGQQRRYRDSPTDELHSGQRRKHRESPADELHSGQQRRRSPGNGNTGNANIARGNTPRSGSRGSPGDKEDLDAVFEKERLESYAAERREKELRADPNFMEDGEGGGADSQDDDDDYGAYVDEEEELPQEEDADSPDDEPPPPPPRKLLKTMSSTAPFHIRGAQEKARGMKQPPVVRAKSLLSPKTPEQQNRQDSAFSYEAPRTVGGVRTAMQYISLQMVVGTAVGSTPFPREKTQKDLLAQWLSVSDVHNVMEKGKASSFYGANVM
jgi:hypothetical protein